MVLAAWIFFLGVMNFQWGTPLLSLRLADSDDYLRMVRVFDLADGNYYPANIQTRMGIEGRVENNWSRLVDAPLLAMLAAFQPFVGRGTAALMTVTIAPALALLLLMFLSVWYPRAAVDEGRFPSASYTFLILGILFVQMITLAQFAPGRVDHDMWQVILVMTGFGFLLRSSFEPQRKFYPVCAGAAFGTGLSIGADMVLWLAMGAAFMGLHWLARGREFERACLRLGAAAFLTAAAEFIVLRPPAYLFEKVCDGISITYVSFAASVAVFFAVIYFIPEALKRTWQVRVTMSAIFSGAILCVLYSFFPSCFHDPYQFTDPVVRKFWLGNISEAESLAAVAAKRPLFAGSLVMLIALAAVSAAIAARVEKDKRLMWVGWCLILLAGLALGFWQIRILRIVQVFTILPLAWPFIFIGRLNPARRDLLRSRTIAVSVVLVVAGLCLFYVSVRRHGDSAPVLAQQAPLSRCSVLDAAPVLNQLPSPKLIAAVADVGPEILYRTKHTVLAGPYHHDEAGIRAVIDLFTAAHEGEARRVADKYRVQVVMLCTAERGIWRRIAPQDSFFAGQLLDGAVPPWLVPVAGSGAGNFMILEVK